MPNTRFELVIFALQVRRLTNLANQANVVFYFYFRQFRFTSVLLSGHLLSVFKVKILFLIYNESMIGIINRKRIKSIGPTLSH